MSSSSGEFMDFTQFSDHQQEGFSLDMVSTDMDFEQAYTMYSNLQQKNAALGVEQLQKVQSLNSQFDSIFGVNKSQPDVEKFNFHRNQILNGISKPKVQPEEEFDQFFSNTESNALESFLDNLASNSTNPLDFYQNGDKNSNYTNSNYQDELSNLFDLRTMKPSFKEKNLHNLLKHEITEAFSHPPVKSLSRFPQPSQSSQLPTPYNQRQQSCSLLDAHSPLSGIENNGALITPPGSTSIMLPMKRSRPETLLESPPISPPDQADYKRQKKNSSKPLLTLEQKRRNHSNSEQKRRQLCKLAYERCLRLITDVEDYENDIVFASGKKNSKKKSKRKQLTKDGLPNLSKHTALLKISNEIGKIKSKNDRLISLLESHGCMTDLQK